MIKPIWEKLHSYSNTLKKLAELEASREEDEDIVEVQEVSEEEPICEDLQEIIEYIKDFNLTRKVDYLAIHCTATLQTATITAIKNYWTNTLGWKNPGYHIIVKPCGEISILHDFNSLANGVRGYNSNSIHISYIGGVENKNGKLVPVDNITEDQFKAMDNIIKAFQIKIPNLKVQGHRDFPNVTKACPCFDTKIKFDLK